ncbi:MAG TPA: helix-hairpin-helix domain-containing protein [Patescibacteria group bacterium]|nr:helix-hairpin-helix domain-containing protein [Patescibacteria group bacterium]
MSRIAVAVLLLGLTGLVCQSPAFAQSTPPAATSAVPAKPSTGNMAGSIAKEMPHGAMIDINKASASELDSLPGIGKKRAQKIIANRPYASTDDLVAKKVLPKSVFDPIKARLVASK